MNFFDTKYNFIADIKDYKKVIDHNDDEENDEDIEENTNIISNKDLYFENYKNLDKFYLYDFIRSQLLKIKNSWYGYKMFRDNKIIKLDEYENESNNKYNQKYNHKYDLKKIYYIDANIYVSYKNIYNFSKSLYLFNHRNNKDETLNKYLLTAIPLNYDCLNIQLKNNLKIILNIINELYYKNDIENEKNEKSILSKFNFTGNVQKKYDEYSYPAEEIFQINKLLVYNIFRSIIDIVFECLCKRGLLSEYIIRINEFEKSNLNQNKNKILGDNYQKLLDLKLLSKTGNFK
jgi:hypothetical protein